MELTEGKLLELTATHRRLPKFVRIVQVKNGKVWVVDDPRTMEIPRYIKIERVDSLYKEVV